MTEQLKQAAQNTGPVSFCEYPHCQTTGAACAGPCSQLTTSQPAQAGEVDTGPRVLREVFALCEDTMTKMEPESTDFSRGRAFEAKGISRAIGTWFQDEFCGRSHMGEPVIAPTQPAAQATPAQDGTRIPFDGEPMSARKAAYFMRRFKREEKLLGPNEQLAIDYVLALLDTQQATPEPREDEARRLIDTLRNDARGGLAATVHELDAAANLIEVLLSATPPQQAAGEPVGEVTFVNPKLRTLACSWNPDAQPWPKVGDKLFTHPAPGVPEGFALVPVEPTAEMMEAMPSLPAIGAPGDMELKANGWSLKAIQNRHRWLAALAAAQAKGNA